MNLNPNGYNKSKSVLQTFNIYCLYDLKDERNNSLYTFSLLFGAVIDSCMFKFQFLAKPRMLERGISPSYHFTITHGGNCCTSGFVCFWAQQAFSSCMYCPYVYIITRQMHSNSTLFVLFGLGFLYCQTDLEVQ